MFLAHLCSSGMHITGCRYSLFSAAVLATVAARAAARRGCLQAVKSMHEA